MTKLPDYDPAKFVIIRDWTNDHDYDIADVLSYLGREGAHIVEINNPYADALSESFPGGRRYSESFAPTIRALRIADKKFLDRYAAEKGPRPMTRDIRVAFRMAGPQHWEVPADDTGIRRGDTWYIERPANLAMQGTSMEVSAGDFTFPPPIVVDDLTLTVYGLLLVTKGPLTINGVELAADRWREPADSARSKLPGGFRWGKFRAQLTVAERGAMLRS